MEDDQAVITVNGPGHSGTRVALQEGITSLGRLPSNDVVLVADRVSRNHARITFFEGRATLQDLGSHNGSYVNGIRIGGAKVLTSGDLCRIGPFQILYRRVVERPGADIAGDHHAPSAEPDPAAVPVAPPGAERPWSSLLDKIEAARSHPDEQPRALQVLLRATEALASASEVDDYLGRMLRLALDQTQALRGAYIEARPCGLQVMLVAGPEGAATDAQVVPAVVEWAVSKNFPVKVDDLADDLRFAGPAQALLCVPVAYGQDVLGALHLARNLPFPAEALDTLVAIAHLTGLGIQASRARRTAVRARFARDTLARCFHPEIADILADPARSDAHRRQLTLLVVSIRGWCEGSARQSQARIAPVMSDFCDRVIQQDGRWYIGAGPTLYATFEDEAGPSRAVALVDRLGSAHPLAAHLRAVVVRGVLVTAVADGEPYRLPLVAGPGLEAAERWLEKVPVGQIWLDEGAARLYPGPTRSLAEGAYLPT